MTALLQKLDIFELRALITNLNCKLSTISEYDARKQLLCLVSEENDIVLRYTSEGGQEVLKLISWFRRTGRVIHDVCFDPTGTWLLVLCFDNTLHIVPALAVVDKTYMAEQQLQQQQHQSHQHSTQHTQQQQQQQQQKQHPLNVSYIIQPYSTTQVTSYIIPFVGPHECPNSKKCPNATTNNIPAAAAAAAAASASATNNKTSTTNAEATQEQSNEVLVVAERLQNIEVSATIEQVLKVIPPTPSPPPPSQPPLPAVDSGLPPVPEEAEDLDEPQPTMEAFSHDVPANMLAPPSVAAMLSNQQPVDKTGNSQVKHSSFMASNTCPYPLSVVWWQTMDGVNRAIIGYSDGSICFVGLSPNCPFVASTTIDNGSVVKLLICRDNTFESVMLLMTSSLKQQFKLLLEQKAIKYIYPGDVSPSSAQARESDWQIVMPLNMSTHSNNNNSNSSDPASDSSQFDEDVFAKNDDTASSSDNSNASKAPTTVNAMFLTSSSQLIAPPPPYSVAVNNRQLGRSSSPPAVAIASSSTSAGVRFQQQQLPTNLDEFSGVAANGAVGGAPGGAGAGPTAGAGLLPAARARLASLRSLGTKKFNAIKMRLSDNRHKLEEYMPENTLGPTFAIMDSPSLTPELLGANTQSSFYTIQNLRNTYLLSALHCQSNTLSVHNIDINLKPLFLYKIPNKCFDILISSNLLYSIQYVDSKNDDEMLIPKLDDLLQQNTEKENRDTALEHEEKVAEEQLLKVKEMPVAGEKGKLANDLGTSGSDVDTSADVSASSGSSLNDCYTPNNMVNAVGVISSAMASLRTGDNDNFNDAAQLGLFRFEHETVLSLYQIASYRNVNEPTENISKEEKSKAFAYQDIRSPMDYVQFYESPANANTEYSLRQMEIMRNEFPKINYDPCYVVTNKNVYYIHLKKEPFAIFLDAALASEWTQCREFCNTFDLNFEICIEFAGDYLLRRKKVTQALLTYNAARIKPIRTALKLAMYGQTNALMHLCAMALKNSFILKSRYFCNPILKTMLADITYRHSEDVRSILPPTKQDTFEVGVVNDGQSCSDYVYGVDESVCGVQMSPSSQFHLANLLLITLAEKAVNDKNYLPLWNFLCTNTKYHTNMTSVVLCQSGLFSAALVLAKTRGVYIDTFLALTSVVGQEFGWYTELNVCLYNLSEDVFVETITYVPQVGMEYFTFIQEKLEYVRLCVLHRLEQQLNPFAATLRPIVSHNSSSRLEHNSNDNNSFIFEFCKSLIETYLAVLICMESQRSGRDCITNALSTFRITYEDNQFAIETARFKPISAGCVHCAYVVDGVAYFWGSNGVPCNYSVSKSSDPPEPAHAVKSLELLSQLNLEVHAVKCGRQHSLILTNNGLYAMGSNSYSQLGIGKHVVTSQQPMLIKAFDGKNITILEAGQYHNAVVADGQLYTWGWGVYGQLGHGDTENMPVPKSVAFFKHKKVLQVSLGHAHSLVLCQSAATANCDDFATELYVFGSNHFGQLGLGSNANNSSGCETAPAFDTDSSYASQVKSVVPLKLEMGAASIRLIHTKFFTNLAVDENNLMYTWGSSPQALRLANQIKRRANAKQKFEEHQKREMTRRMENTTLITQMTPVCTNSCPSGQSSDSMMPLNAEVVATKTIITTEISATTSSTDDGDIDGPVVEQKVTVTQVKEEETVESSNGDESSTSDAALSTVAVDVVELSSTSSADAPIIEEVVRSAVQVLEDAVEEIVPEAKPLAASPLKRVARAPEDVLDAKKIDFTQPKPAAVPEVDPCEHMSPHLVDTSEVAGQILQISSGLFHFALISSSCTLYTWGKNLEHQLGTADKERRAVHKPAPIDSFERPMYVDCGADFTLVMTTDHVVKAFGGNSNGQCGRDLGPSIEKMKQRVVCLPSTKRLMRFESQCVEVPVEINLPRPRIRLDNEPVRYLKSIPRYHAHFMQPCTLKLHDNATCGEYERASASQQYKSTTRGEESSGDNAYTAPDSDDLISSLENLSNNDDADVSLNAYASMPCAVATTETESSAAAAAPRDEQEQLLGNDNSDDPNRPPGGASLSSKSPAGDDELQHYIHYCLYMFHGLYDPEKVRDFTPKSRLEYRVRTLMLNFKFVDAFTLSLQACRSAATTLRLFEYFSKDATGCVPIRRQDVKFLIYYLLLHFLAQRYDMLEAERYFLADLDYYLLELAYVLYFNNNNTALEHDLNQKFKSLIAQEEDTGTGSGGVGVGVGAGAGVGSSGSGATQQQHHQQQQQQGEHKLEDTDVIFDSLSVKFKTIVCQRLLKYCNN